jgi:hypothetical protein
MNEPITTENVAAQRSYAARISNLFGAFPGKAWEGVDEGWLNEIDTVCSAHPADFSTSSHLQVDVGLWFCRQLPALNLLPRDHDPNVASFLWGKIRCLLAGFGFPAHAACASYLLTVYPQCDLDPAETFEEWTQQLTRAHEIWGIPCNLSAVPMRRLKAVLPVVVADAFRSGLLGDLRILQIPILLHVAKHVRRWGTDQLMVTYAGRTLWQRCPDTTNVLDTPTTRPFLLPALGLPLVDNRAKEAPMVSLLTMQALRGLSHGSLLRAVPLTEIDPALLYGPFSHTAPDPAPDEGFSYSGLRLVDVWKADNGRVIHYEGDESTLLSCMWPSEPGDCLGRDEYVASLPATYEAELPFEVFRREYFRNVDMSWAGKHEGAILAFYSAVICASVLRVAQPTKYAGQLPLVWCLPAVPTPDQSTGQGKTSAAELLVRIWAPSVRPTRVPDSSSAPDVRAVNGYLRKHGTFCADEWKAVKSEAHPFSSKSLQALATGGAHSGGEVLENSPDAVVLRQSMVINAKTMDLLPDVVNRSVFVWFNMLSAAEASRAHVMEAIRTGAASLRVRLAALALCEKFGLGDSPLIGHAEYRFPAILGLALSILRITRPEATPEEVIDAINTMRGRFDHHRNEADQSGLTTMMQDEETLNLRVSTVFEGLGPEDMMTLVNRGKARCPDGRLSIVALIRARGEMMGLDNVPMARVLTTLGGTPIRMSDRAISLALARDIRRRIPREHMDSPLPDMLGVCGWMLRRNKDLHGTCRVSIVCSDPTNRVDGPPPE